MMSFARVALLLLVPLFTGCACGVASRSGLPAHLDVECASPERDAQVHFLLHGAIFIGLEEPSRRSVPYIDENAPSMLGNVPTCFICRPSDDSYQSARKTLLLQLYAETFNFQMKRLSEQGLIEFPRSLTRANVYYRDAVADAQTAFLAKDHKLLLVDGVTRELPSNKGISQKWRTELRTEVISGTSDYSTDFHEQQQNNVAVIYAKWFNDEMIRLLEDNGGRAR